ncbi:MAG: hypothetical protein U5L74_01020 [Ideonella sp.]|nr:hypothetical protein [Ideonella sp.]
MHGLIKRAGRANAPENHPAPECRYFIAVLHRDQTLSLFIKTHGANLELCLKVARGLVDAVADVTATMFSTAT